MRTTTTKEKNVISETNSNALFQTPSPEIVEKSAKKIIEYHYQMSDLFWQLQRISTHADNLQQDIAGLAFDVLGFSLERDPGCERIERLSNIVWEGQDKEGSASERAEWTYQQILLVKQAPPILFDKGKSIGNPEFIPSLNIQSVSQKTLIALLEYQLLTYSFTSVLSKALKVTPKYLFHFQDIFFDLLLNGGAGTVADAIYEMAMFEESDVELSDGKDLRVIAQQRFFEICEAFHREESGGKSTKAA